MALPCRLVLLVKKCLLANTPHLPCASGFELNSLSLLLDSYDVAVIFSKRFLLDFIQRRVENVFLK